MKTGSSEKITLYHSTDENGLNGAKASGCLFGCERLGEVRNSNRGSNLTPDRAASRNFIVSYKGEGQWRSSEGPSKLFTMVFDVPTEIVRDVGLTHGFGCMECGTTLTVDANDLPPDYLKSLHAGMMPMTKEEAIRLQQQGEIRFYQVPLEFLSGVEPVSFTYKGARYPAE